MREARAAPDPAALEAALVPILEGWEEFSWLDAGDPGLDLDTRLCATECARVVADLDARFRPPGVERLQALQRAADFTPTSSPFLRIERARLEADLIEELNHLGRFDQGLARLETVRADFADVPQVLAEMLLMEANVEQLLGSFRQAIAAVREARGLLEHLSEEQAPSSFTSNYARVVEALILIDIGLPDRAAGLVHDCLAELEASDDRSSETMVMTAATRLAFARGDFEWLLEILLPRLEGEGIAGDDPRQRLERWVDVACARGRLALSEGRGVPAARDALEAAIADLGSASDGAIGATLVLCDLEFELGQLASVAGRIERSEAALASSSVRSSLLVLSALAVLKGRLALEQPADTEGLSSALVRVEAAYDDMLQAWASVPPREGGIGFLLFSDRRALLVTLIRLQVATQGAERGAALSLPLLLRAEQRGTLADLLGVGPTTPERVERELVPERGGLLIYLPSYVGTIALAIDRRGTRAWEVPGTDAWKPSYERLSMVLRPEAALLADSAEREQREALALRDLLIPEELDQRIGTWEELTLIGAENLGWIPFEALPLRGRGERAIGLELAVSYLPSMTVGSGLLERSQARPAAPAAAPRVLVAVGPGTTSDALAPLPWRAADGSRLAGHWSAAQLEVVSDPAQALRATLDAGRRSSALLEVIAHGVVDASRERGQGFQFDDATRLFPEDFQQGSCPPIAVLAVCGAGKGVLRAGDDGASHLGGALLGAGADCVLLSKQNLSFEASLALLEVFNREVSAGASPARAMLAARRQVAARPGWERPAYHSLLHVVGLGGRPLPAPLLAAPQSPAAGRSRLPFAVVLASAGGLLVLVLVLAYARSRRRRRVRSGRAG